MMEATATRRKRTREEILAWLDEARQRKDAWEKKVQSEFAERKRIRKEVAEPSIKTTYYTNYTNGLRP